MRYITGMLKINSCNLCGGKTFLSLYHKEVFFDKPWSKFISPTFFPLTLSANLCIKCGWIFQNPSYDLDEIHRLYNISPTHYKKLLSKSSGFHSHLRGKQVFDDLKPWMDLDLYKSVLDVGGSNGELMGEFIKYGFNASTLDMCSGKAMRSVKKIRSPFLQHQNYSYDILVMLHILEHTTSPKAFLSHARSLLNRNGLLYIEVPSELLTPILFRHIGDHLHIGYFSRKTLKAFLETSGFDCFSCQLVIGSYSGAPLPVIRAIARKSESSKSWRPSRLMALLTIFEALHPLPLFARIKARGLAI